jgi:chemotaxis protein methyltransferase CheR
VNSAEFDFLSRFLQERSGLTLVGDKAYLVESRLMPIAQKHKMASLSVLISALRTSGNVMLETDIVEAMATHETFFFRDKTPFELFNDTMLPALLKARKMERALRIWSAACSTGQEPYSLAMLLKERQAELAGWRIDIIATDLSTSIIAQAKAASYTQFEVQRGLPINLLVKYFEQKGDRWVIKPEITNMVHFRPLNLLRDFSALGSFDIVFCRNVLIYVNDKCKADVLNRIAGILKPDGYLLMGAAETVIGLTERFRPHTEKRGLYQRSPDVAHAVPSFAFGR